MSKPAPLATNEALREMLAKAKPCPFCGWEELTFAHGSVACDACQTEGPFEAHFTDLDSYATAVENWNRRI